MGMLALTRRKGQEVYIGDPADPLGIVRVVDIQGDKVKLAFQFPRELPVNRRELAEEKARDAREKAAARSEDAASEPPAVPERAAPQQPATPKDPTEAKPDEPAS